MDKINSIVLFCIKKGDEKAFEQLYHEISIINCCVVLQSKCHMIQKLRKNQFLVLFFIWDTRNTLLKVLSLLSYFINSVCNKSMSTISYYAYQSTSKSISLNSKSLLFNDFLSVSGYLIYEFIEEKMKKQLIGAINALPNVCRKVFRMSCFEGKMHFGIANGLDVPVNIFKCHIKNVIKQLSILVDCFTILLYILLCNILFDYKFY